jgi:hypothetical protein
MASRAYRESHEVATLAECAGSESIRLRALRSNVSGAIATPEFAVLKRRISAIKNELHERTETAGPSCNAASCSLVDACSKNPKKAPFCLIFSQAQGGFQGGDALRISFRRCDIRQAWPLFGESKA